MLIGISINTSKFNYQLILKKIWVGLKNEIPDCKVKVFLDGNGLEEEKYNLSFLFIVGGDGTILRNVGILREYQIGIIGINYGTLGFLAGLEVSDIERAIKALKQNDYYIEKRIMLSTLVNADSSVKEYVSLNDVVIMKLPMSRLLKFKIFIDDKCYSSFSGDGLIVATPTGSTAYSLSAGGPIVSPDIQSIIITPICPHSLNAKSIVVSSESVIKLEIDKIDENCYVIVDGKREEIILGKQIIEISKYKESCLIVRFDFYDYYNVLREKLINRI